jgi:DNA replication protein DnaC
MKYKNDQIAAMLRTLCLTSIEEHYEEMSQEAARERVTYTEYLTRLLQQEIAARYERSVIRRTRAAKLPVVKTLEQFDWSWPHKINREMVMELFRLKFIEQARNAVFIGGVGLGKTHLALALAHSACMQNITTLFAPAVEIVNQLAAAQHARTLSKALNAYLKPQLLVIDELGYLPMDKCGADLIFQVISARCEKKSTVITTNTVYKKWAHIFNNDATLTSAILDRLLHHCETIIIEGKSYRTQKEEVPINR